MSKRAMLLAIVITGLGMQAVAQSWIQSGLRKEIQAIDDQIRDERIRLRVAERAHDVALRDLLWETRDLVEKKPPEMSSGSTDTARLDGANREYLALDRGPRVDGGRRGS